MFSVISELIFGASTTIVDNEPQNVTIGSSTTAQQGFSEDKNRNSCNNINQTDVTSDASEIEPPIDDWVIVKNEQETFTLSTELVTRSRVNFHEDLSRENFLIEYPLSLSSSEIDMRVIKMKRRSKRKGNKRSSNNGSNLQQQQSKQDLYEALLHSKGPSSSSELISNRALTSLSTNHSHYERLPRSFKLHHERRRHNYNYIKYSGANNNRKMSNQRQYQK